MKRICWYCFCCRVTRFLPLKHASIYPSAPIALSAPISRSLRCCFFPSWSIELSRFISLILCWYCWWLNFSCTCTTPRSPITNCAVFHTIPISSKSAPLCSYLSTHSSFYSHLLGFYLTNSSKNSSKDSTQQTWRNPQNANPCSPPKPSSYLNININGGAKSNNNGSIDLEKGVSAEVDTTTSRSVTSWAWLEKSDFTAFDPSHNQQHMLSMHESPTCVEILVAVLFLVFFLACIGFLLTIIVGCLVLDIAEIVEGLR